MRHLYVYKWALAYLIACIHVYSSESIGNTGHSPMENQTVIAAMMKTTYGQVR